MGTGHAWTQTGKLDNSCYPICIKQTQGKLASKMDAEGELNNSGI